MEPTRVGSDSPACTISAPSTKRDKKLIDDMLQDDVIVTVRVPRLQ